MRTKNYINGIKKSSQTHSECAAEKNVSCLLRNLPLCRRERSLASSVLFCGHTEGGDRFAHPSKRCQKPRSGERKLTLGSHDSKAEAEAAKSALTHSDVVLVSRLLLFLRSHSCAHRTSASSLHSIFVSAEVNFSLTIISVGCLPSSV